LNLNHRQAIERRIAAENRSFPMNRRLTSGAIAFLVTLLATLAQTGAAQGVTATTITDPAYNVKAFDINIPAGWKFQGTVLPGPDCSDLPYPVFRAYSPDGLSELRLEPAFNWTFHPNNRAFRPVPGCVNISGPITAEEFLKRYEEMVAGSGMHVIGPMSVGPAYEERTAKIADNMNHLSPDVHGSANAAAVRVQTINGSFVIEQRFRAYVECRVRAQNVIDPNGGGCSAHVDVVRAPKGKLDSLCAFIDSHDLVKAKFDNAWAQRVHQTIAEKNQQRAAQLTRQQQAGAAMLKKQFDDFMATSQRNHEAFMAQQESSYRTHQAQMAQSASSFHSSMNNANQAMNARSTASSDWVDYALDQQTVTGQGGTQKVSSAYSHTWSSTVGNETTWYQTNNPNANPNGVLGGNWTEDTKVHGNGQPY
jgi:hypothetical protein